MCSSCMWTLILFPWYIGKQFFFFFLIGKKKYIQKTARCKKHQHIKNTKKKKQKTKTRNINYKERELRKRGRKSLDVSPQALAQSNRELEKRASIWSSNLSKSSNVCQLRSFQIHHIKHNGTKFQMLDECFPNQFHQLKRKSDTVHEETHEIPKVRKTKHHNQ